MLRTPFALLLAAVFCSVGPTAQSPSGRVVGYFPSWGIYARNYHVPQIPAAQLTHINYAFANVVQGRIALGDPYADIDRFYPGDCWNPGCRRGSFQQLRLLKQAHPHLKTLISVGGWTWSSNFSDAVLTPQSRAIFAQSIVDFVVEHGFDGADIDWEYPVSGGLGSNTTRAVDRIHYPLFLAELRAQFTARTATTGQTYLLTIAAPAPPAIIANFDLAAMHPHLDWINVMTYDFHGPWGDPVTGMNAPLYEDPADPSSNRATWNAAAAMRSYLGAGVPSAKLHIGVPFYGRGFGSVQSTTDGLYAAYGGPSSPGTWENGVYDYDDLVARYIGRNGYAQYWNDAARVPWLFHPTARTFISYDDPRAVAEKAWFARQHGLGGVFFWELSGDRGGALLATLSRWIRERPALVAADAQIALTQPRPVAISLVGGIARATRSYVVAASTEGTWPGLALGNDTLPLRSDWLLGALPMLLGSPIAPGFLGTLDASGSAAAAFDLTRLGVLPPAMLGLRIHAAAWVFDSSQGVNGQPSNPIEITFRR
jgi:chitinase